MWDKNVIQFARLLSEIDQVVKLSFEQEMILCKVMEITPCELHDLFARAKTEWQAYLDKNKSQGV